MGSEPPSEPEDETGVFSPEDLDFTGDERVSELRDGQYVISTDESTRDAEAGFDFDNVETAGPQVGGHDVTDDDPTPSPATDSLHDQLARYIDDTHLQHGFFITTVLDGDVDQKEVYSDDLATVFRELLAWYTKQVDANTPSAEVLGILLLAADTQVQYPDRVLAELLDAYDLSPDDSIADLVAAVETDGFTVPPDG